MWNVLQNLPAESQRFRRILGSLWQPGSVFWGSFFFIDLLMGLFRGAVFDHGRAPENCPLALIGHFPSLLIMGRFPTLMGRFPECLNGRFLSWKSAGRQPTKKRPIKRLLIFSFQYRQVLERLSSPCGNFHPRKQKTLQHFPNKDCSP